MSIYKKLNQARVQLQDSGMEKNGKNQNFSYFELKDFLPKINRINDEIGLCVVCSFDKEFATLTIFDTESDQTIVFTSPMAGAKLPNGQAIQNLGATETYERRYLYLTAYEIVEHDKIDAMTPEQHKEATKPKIYSLDGEGKGELQVIINKCETLQELTETYKQQIPSGYVADEELSEMFAYHKRFLIEEMKGAE